jgi:hypothetical protein
MAECGVEQVEVGISALVVSCGMADRLGLDIVGVGINWCVVGPGMRYVGVTTFRDRAGTSEMGVSL